MDYEKIFAEIEDIMHVDYAGALDKQDWPMVKHCRCTTSRKLQRLLSLPIANCKPTWVTSR